MQPGKSTIAAAGALFFLIAGGLDVAMNGGTPRDVLWQRGATLSRLLLRSRSSSTTVEPAGRGPREFRFAPLQQPGVEPVETTVVTDLAEVIGVSIGGEYRAYAVQTMAIPRARVIDDVVGDTRVVVMYNPTDDRARVLIRGPDDGAVTNFHGFLEGQMEIEIDGQMRPFDAVVLPLHEVAAVRLTWGEWKAAHPSTTVLGRIEMVSIVLPDDLVRAAARKKPVHEPGDSARLVEAMPVFGVTVGSRSRAYVRAAMCSPATHVVNDMLGDTAVTVTYCDITDQARVFTEAGRHEALDVLLYGRIGGKMNIKVRDQVFAQDDNKIPLPELDFVRTTWGEWKSLHPHTDVFTGNWNDAASSD
jgi:hypothetical protein